MNFYLRNFRAYGVDERTYNPTSSCQVPDFSPSQSCEDVLALSNSSQPLPMMTTCDPSDLIYDTSVVESSLVQKFGFACDREYLTSLFNSLYMVGLALGGVSHGVFSDRYGRVAGLLVSLLTLSVSGTVSAFVDSPGAFAVLRVLTGVGAVSVYPIRDGS